MAIRLGIDDVNSQLAELRLGGSFDWNVFIVVKNELNMEVIQSLFRTC
jgi:hypothetical protein